MMHLRVYIEESSQVYAFVQVALSVFNVPLMAETTCRSARKAYIC